VVEMSDTKLKEQLKMYSKEKLINILIDFVNVCHKQEDIINKATDYIYENCFDEIKTICIDDLWCEDIKNLLDILKGVDKE
jgi:hypothetical protein